MPAVIKFVLKVVLLAVVFYVLTRFDVLPGLDVIPDPTGPLGEPGTYLWIGLLFGLVNAIVGPILRFFTLPFVVLTLGLFLLVINAGMLLLTAWIAERLDIGFHVDGFWSALLGSIVITVVNSFIDMAVLTDD